MTMQKTVRQVMVGLILLAAIPVLSFGASGKTQAWIDVLQSEAPLFEKCRACQQLGESGSKEVVPVLVSLLNHEFLSTYARAGLERIPGPEGRAALRNALTQIQGKRLVGVIHSLAGLRDERAVGALIGLTQEAEPDVAKAALLALGRIATDEAISVVLKALDGPSNYRSEAAAACLLAAQNQFRAEKTARASALYDAVRKADVPLSYRIGATRGAILSRQTDATLFLIDQLRSSEPAIRNVAILTIRQNPKEAFASALNAAMDNASQELQVQMLEAFQDCHNQQSLSMIRAKVNSGNDLLRLTALKTLREIGGPDTASVLIKVLQENRDATEVSIVVSTLEHMEGPGIDALILEALSSGSDSEVRVEVIRLLGKRSATDASDALFEQAVDSETQVAVAACQALGRLVGPSKLPRLIQLTRACQRTKVRDAAALAVYDVCQKKPKNQAGSLVLQALKDATATSEKLAWIRVLVLLGHSESLPTIVAMLQDADETLVKRTIFYVGQWPDPSPVQALFAVVENHSNATLRTGALVAVLQLATRAAEQKQMDSETLMRWFQRASKAAQSTQEKRLLISGLSRIRQEASVRLLTSYLRESDVKMEAIYAIVNAAGPVAKGPGYGVVETALEKIGDVQDTRLRTQIAALKQDIKGTKAKLNKASQ